MSELFLSWWPQIQIYLGTGLAALVVLRVASGIIQKRTKANASEDEFLTLLAAKQPVKSNRQKLVEGAEFLGLLALFVLFWPFILLLYLVFKLNGSEESWEPKPEDAFECKLNCLRQKVTPEMAEAEAMVTDPKGRVPAKPFGHLNDGWKRFLALGQPGFELWTFTIIGEEVTKPKVAN